MQMPGVDTYVITRAHFCSELALQDDPVKTKGVVAYPQAARAVYQQQPPSFASVQTFCTLLPQICTLQSDRA